MKFNFFDEVHDFQRYVRENLRFFGKYQLISEQLMVTNNLKGFIDMLVLDLDDNRLTILELKNVSTSDKDSWQPIRYYDLLNRGQDSLRELIVNNQHNLSVKVDDIDFDPKVVLIVPEYDEQLLRTLSYFENIDSKVIEVNVEIKNGFTQYNKKVHYPKSIFHKEDLVKVTNKINFDWSFDEYRKSINSDKLSLADQTLKQMKQIFANKQYNFDVFYSKTKITVTKDNKVWANLFISQRPLDYKLSLSFKSDKPIKSSDFSFSTAIEKFEEQKNGIKLEISSKLNDNILDKYL